MLAPPRTARPRHKAAPARPSLGLRRPGPRLRRAGLGLGRTGLAAAVRKLTSGRLDRASIPAGTGGVASGLAAASIGALVTIMIANSGHAAVPPHLAMPATRVAADMPSLHMPRPVYHPRTVARRKQHRAHHVRPQLAAGQQAPAAGPLSGITSDINWQALETRSGVPAWAQRMLSTWSQSASQRDSSAGQPPAHGSADGQAPSWP
jgi:hypothetical protein